MEEPPSPLQLLIPSDSLAQDERQRKQTRIDIGGSSLIVSRARGDDPLPRRRSLFDSQSLVHFPSALTGNPLAKTYPQPLPAIDMRDSRRYACETALLFRRMTTTFLGFPDLQRYACETAPLFAKGHKARTRLNSFRARLRRVMDSSDFRRPFIATVWPPAFSACCGGLAPTVESGHLSVPIREASMRAKVHTSRRLGTGLPVAPGSVLPSVI